MARIFREIRTRNQAGLDAGSRVVPSLEAQGFRIKEHFRYAIGAVELHPLCHKTTVFIFRISRKIDAPCAAAYRNSKQLVMILNAFSRA